MLFKKYFYSNKNELVQISYLKHSEVDEFIHLMSLPNQKRIFGTCEPKDYISARTYTIKIKKEIVGYFNLDFCEEDNSLCLWGLYVKPQHRNKKIASNVINLIIENYKNKIKFILGTVNKKNKIPFNFYKNHFYFLKKIKINNRDCVIPCKYDEKDEEKYLKIGNDFKILFYEYTTVEVMGLI